MNNSIESDIYYISGRTKENVSVFDKKVRLIELKESLGDYDCLIHVQTCAICHTDFFCQKDQIPGHEVIGVIQAIGNNVKDVRIGDRVGMGYQKSSCLKCEDCNDGNTQFCSKMKYYHSDLGGGFSTHCIWDSRFCFKIPDSISSELAAPLLCAGITVYSALTKNLPTMTRNNRQVRVAVVGIGGLGHLALQYANKMGLHVTALSGSVNKKDEASEMGAHAFVNNRDENELKKCKSTFDLIINTVSGDLDWNMYLRLLKPNGAIVLLGIPVKNIAFKAQNLILRNRKVVGSVIGTREEMIEMLEYSALNDIKPKIQTYPMNVENINFAWNQVNDNQVRYRAVLINDKFTEKSNL